MTDQDKETRDRLFESVKLLASRLMLPQLTKQQRTELEDAINTLQARIKSEPAQCCGRCEWFKRKLLFDGSGKCCAPLPQGVYAISAPRITVNSGAECKCFKERCNA